MNIKYLNLLTTKPEILQKKIQEYLEAGTINNQAIDENEIKGHIEKAEHNLNFVKDNLKLGYTDWCITGCYYAVYQAALALTLSKGYHSKNHDATLCILIKEHYKVITEEDLELINKFYIDYQELLIYVQAKNKREDATYSSNYKFSNEIVNEQRMKSIKFINKAKEILNYA